MRLLITGASGFIGSALVRHIDRNEKDIKLRLFNRNSNQNAKARLKCSIASSLDNTTDTYSPNAEIIYGDLTRDVSGICEGMDAVIHLAAKTYVDHSIKDPVAFLTNNVEGTVKLLEDARVHKVKRFISVSTDEVLGSISKGAYDEQARLNPSNPYAASKAAADCFAISYANTYGMHITVTRTENNYGPFQHPQKVFPAFLKKLLNGEKVSVYGDGRHVRQWLWVYDHVEALLALLKTDYPSGEIFHIAGNQELTNLKLARRIITEFKKLAVFVPPKIAKAKVDECIEFIPDHDIRPGHDYRYALNCDKIKLLTGWSPKVSLDEGIAKAISWYVHNKWWLNN